MTELWSFDLDGVLAEPPFGWNPAINRRVSLLPESDHVLPPPAPEQHLDRLLAATWYRVRYLLRPPRSGAIEAVRSAADRGRVIVLTGRHERGRRQTEAWLKRHGFFELLDGLVMNHTGLKTVRYKEAYLGNSEARLHIDDDAATAALLARCGVACALVSWPRNQDLDYPAGVVRCADMYAVRELIERMARDD
jgi:FMN phosphatase YigB (HAD superfamily)